MKKLIVLVLLVGLALWGCDTTTGCLGDFANQAHAAVTDVSDSTNGGNDAGYQRTIVKTGAAANDLLCFPTQGFRYVYHQSDISGTINYDIDHCLDATCSSTIVDEVVADKTADFADSEVVVSPFVCFDVDSCTTCTISTTILLGR